MDVRVEAAAAGLRAANTVDEQTFHQNPLRNRTPPRVDATVPGPLLFVSSPRSPSLGRRRSLPSLVSVLASPVARVGVRTATHRKERQKEAKRKGRPRKERKRKEEGEAVKDVTERDAARSLPRV